MLLNFNKAADPLPLPPSNGTPVSSFIRNKLRLDPQIGAGNFIFYAQMLNPRPSLPILHLEVPFESFNGKIYEVLSLNELVALVKAYASFLYAYHVRRMDVVPVYLDDGVGYLILYMAIASLGAIPALLNGALSPDIAVSFFDKLKAKIVLSNKDRIEKLIEAGLNSNLSLLDFNQLGVSGLEPSLPIFYPYQHQPDEPVFITHSSGTTGIPKAITLTHGGFFHGIRHLLGLPLMDGFEKLLSSLPSSHNSAIAYAMYALLSGAELMLMSSRKGLDVLEKIEQFMPTTVVSFPETYVDMVDTNQLPEYQLSSLSTWINSGDAAHEKHIKELVKYGSHLRGGLLVEGSQFVDGLGSSEMGHTLFRIIHTLSSKNYERCIGLPQPWVEAAVLSEDGQILNDNEIGFLGVKAPSVTIGYWNDSHLTHQSRLSGYFLTGDVVKRDELGRYYHLDRIPDVIHADNGKIYSVFVEELLMSKIALIFDCTVFAISEELEESEKSKNKNLKNNLKIILIAVKKNDKKNDKKSDKEIDFSGEDPLDLEKILAEVNQVMTEHGLEKIHEIKFYERSEIPVGVTGKVLKRAMRKSYMEERLLC